MASSLDDFQQRLGHAFADPALLRLALTHASFGHEKRQRTPDNQRLEFLGDAVLQLAVTSELYRRFPELPEGPDDTHWSAEGQSLAAATIDSYLTALDRKALDRKGN